MSAAQKAQSPVAAGQSANETTDAMIVAQSLEERKREATLRAKFALRGHAVHRTVEGGYLVCRHGLVKHCPDLDSLEGFARTVGAL
jgi:hypothetical protein